ncbi:MAG: hypothetical protein GY791_11705 [Alphaproteobacteria bacterium]|nr:hypothetical protein [Alphaproteobacteria bacterium]
MHLRLETRLACSAEAAWAAEQEVSLLNRLSAPFLVFHGAAGTSLPDFWTEGGTVVVESRLFGWLALGRQQIFVAKVDAATRTIRTRESGTWIRRWDHSVAIAEAGASASRYIDDIDFDAGFLGPLLWPLAWAFYRYRQWRRHAMTRRSSH